MRDPRILHAQVAAAVRKARIFGLILCVAWPLALMAMISAGAIRPGALRVEGWVQQAGYTFTAMSLLAAACAKWRTGKLMAEFKELPESERPKAVFWFSAGFAVLFFFSSVYGLIYWRLAGRNAFQHVMAFAALSPVMFFLFTPRLHRWIKALEGPKTGP